MSYLPESFHISKSLSDTLSIAEGLFQEISDTNSLKRNIIALSGDLGAGKTTFSQAIARTLGITGAVTSPTYVIMKMYEVDHPSVQTLVHIDAYRLESGRDLELLGWNDLIIDPKTLILIEWPEKIQEILPASTITLSFETINEHTRTIEIRG